ncbi:MAG TPA: thioesterase family protein [Solirubrobacteraceae bacterium]|nr:thioesterase family protein [Solirubrobacteraceae bacterium]
MAAVDDWPFAHTDEIRFADLDTQGHLNNVSFLVFVESARIAYAVAVARAHPELTPSASFTFMVVEVKISYRSPGQFGERIETRLRPSAVGRSSFHMDFEMRAGERRLADGYSVLVTYDPVAGRPIAVPQPLRERLLADGAIQR